MQENLRSASFGQIKHHSIENERPSETMFSPKSISYGYIYIQNHVEPQYLEHSN